MSQLSVQISSEDRVTLKEMENALFLSGHGKLIAYICDRYRAGALHIIPALSSEALATAETERIKRIARNEARLECMAVLYEERFITDPKVR